MKSLTTKLRQEYEKEAKTAQPSKYSSPEAAGCIFIAKNTGRILLAKRSSEEDYNMGVDEPGTWSTWGGDLNTKESPKQAAMREVEEEVGYDGEYKLVPLWTYKDASEGFKYHNFMAIVPMEFTPKLNWENESSKWVDFGEWPSPMHFGLSSLIQHAGPKIQKVIKLIKRKHASVLEAMDAPPPAIVQHVQTNASSTNAYKMVDAYIVATTLWGEARGEGEQGMQAVMNVIMNRSNGDFKKASKMVLVPKQFSMWNNIDNPEQYALKLAELHRKDKTWTQCLQIVDLAMKGKLKDITGGALFYFNPKKANPSWASKMVKTVTIGNHEFYKPAPKVTIHKKSKMKAAVNELLNSKDPNSIAIIKKGIVGVGEYEYELRSPFSTIRYRHEPDSKIFYLDSIATPDEENQGKGYAKALLESFFRLIKQYGGALDCDTYTTSGMTKIKHAVEQFAKQYGVRLLQGVEKTVESAPKPNTLKQWFGKSKVVDSNGNPLKVYKGMKWTDDLGKAITHIQRPGEVPSFDKDEPGIKVAGFFTSDEGVAKKFCFNGECSVKAFYLRIENPFVIDLKGAPAGTAQFEKGGKPYRNALRSGKHDGAILLNTKDEGNVFVIIDPRQAKLVGNVKCNPDEKNFALNESYDKYKSQLWVHYTDVDYLKLNYSKDSQSKSSNDPVAIYLFPEGQNIDNYHFFKQKKNKIYVQVANVKVLDLSKLSTKDFKHFDINEKELHNMKSFLAGGPITGTKMKVPEAFWTTLRTRFKDGEEFRKYLISKGYDAVFDDVEAIHFGETQLLVLDDSKVQVSKIVPNKPINENQFITKKGSAITRYKNNVGKRIGSQIYVHKDYAVEVIPQNVLQLAITILDKKFPGFAYNCVTFDPQKGVVRFDQTPDFDTAREPHVGDYVAVWVNGTAPPVKGHSDSIWHHKWLWVKDDYKGFDVDKSKEWSKLWLSKVDGPAKGTKNTWDMQLRNAGLLKEGYDISALDAEINRLEAEWDKFDSGQFSDKQYEIQVQLGALRKERERQINAKKSSWDKHKDKWASVKASIDKVQNKGFAFTDTPTRKRHSESYKPKSGDAVFGGVRWPERIEANIVRDNNGYYGHTREMGHDRWVYYQSNGVVYWHKFPPDEKRKELVDVWLAEHGYKVQSHKDMKDYYVTIKENLVMEAQRATPKQLVEFIRAQIKGTEWDGKVFAVGGFVRDLLLGKEPKDLDVVIGVDQGGLKFTQWLGQKLGIYKEGSNPVIFPTFSTANLRLDGVVWNGIDFSGENIDAVMFRKEQYHDPSSRKPVVQFTPHIEMDAQRRDITFNSLYLDIASGEILDPTGTGKEDLKNGIIRTAIDPTIIYTDDALRMFRAVRFASQFGFKLDPSIVDGIKKNLHRLGNTSRERVRDELNKILASKYPEYGLRLLRDTGLLPYVGEEFQKMVGMTQNVHHKDDVFDHTLAVVSKTQPEVLNRLIALFHDIGKVATRAVTPKGVQFIGHEDVGPDIVEKIMMSLKYPRATIDAVKLGVSQHMKLKHGGHDAVKLTDKTLRKFKIALGEYLENLLDVMHADNISHADASAMPNQIEAIRQRLKALDVQVTKPVLPINGNDLLALGVKPGPMIGKILSAVTEKWYENPNVSKEEAMHIAKSILNGSS